MPAEQTPEAIELRQNIKARLNGCEVIAVNLFDDAAQIIVNQPGGPPPTWIDVRVGSVVDVGGQPVEVVQIAGTAGKAPEGRSPGRVTVRALGVGEHLE